MFPWHMIQICCSIVFFSCSISYSMDNETDLFVKYDRTHSLILRTESHAFKIDSVPTHIQMKKEVNLVRSFFQEIGIESLWKKEKGTLGNIASSVIEFIFNDGISVQHSVLSNKEYFTTITNPVINSKFENYLSTYSPTNLKPVFNKTKGLAKEFYTDTEVQIVAHLFFKDQYYQKLLLTLKERLPKIKAMLFSIINNSFEDENLQNLKKIETTISSLEDIKPFLSLVPDFKQYVENINSAIANKENSRWTKISNALVNIRKEINQNSMILVPLAAKDLIGVILHIHTELDPCQNCRNLLSNLSRAMNSKNCNPNSFFQCNHLPLENAQFMTIVSSSLSYPSNDLRNKLPIHHGGIEETKNCIFMAIDKLQSSVSVLSDARISK